jgi:hypothetical protein
VLREALRDKTWRWGLGLGFVAEGLSEDRVQSREMIQPRTFSLPAMVVLLACSSDVTSDTSNTSSSGVGGTGGTGAGGQISASGSGGGGANAGGAGGANVGGRAAVGGGGGAGGDLGCAGALDSNACHACCVQDHSAGFATFNGAFNACGCFGAQACYGTCSAINSLCGPDGPPIDDCATCAVSALTGNGDCTSDATFIADCNQDPDCAAYLACFHSCS